MRYFEWFTRLIAISKRWSCHDGGLASLISREASCPLASGERKSANNSANCKRVRTRIAVPFFRHRKFLVVPQWCPVSRQTGKVSRAEINFGDFRVYRDS